MAEKDETTWVFDALVGFLQGSFWSTSIQNFIEEKSLIFESETLDSKEYREIHQDYKNFVNLLLDCYMEDMGIIFEQFEQACSLIKSTRVSIKFQQGLFEQIWAANEYEVFRRMMTQKNLELQLQSLKMIEKKSGLTPASLSHESNKLNDDQLPMEELLQTKIYEISDENILDAVNVNAKENESVSLLKQEHYAIGHTKKNAHQELNESTKRTSHFEDKQKAKLNAESNIYDKSKTEQQHAVVAGIPSIIDTISTNFRKELHVKQKDNTKEDIHNRQLYLNAQRDKLAALKNKARNQKFRMDPVRPNSAHVVAEAAVNIKKQDLIVHQQAMDASILQVRKALAARLKAEVVQK
ncbi:PREDICTED: cilia- and flagella-associated protein 36 [Ceratosolen solmsi marchali]|uniref:Cilia- and flagella-associated protein 36 n=1 Tax=Ceratosolen solmsi marchali TaxID=326594 RepID=A0AAJ6YED3_9HYME|nr:PREDICTED: cilia- and flagella-associated protein 36 [Ceratosolen solmsi marchali]